MARIYATAFDIQKIEKKFGLETLDYAKSWAREKDFSGRETEHTGLWLFHAGKQSGLETEILIEKRMVKEWVCNCPLFQPKSYCLHVIAGCAFISNEIRKGIKPAAPAKLKHSDSLTALLQSSSNSEIQEAIIMLGKQIPGVVHYFKANLLPLEGLGPSSSLVKNFTQFISKRQQPSKQISQKHQAQIVDLANYYLLISRQKMSQGYPIESLAYVQSLFEIEKDTFPQPMLLQWVPLLGEGLRQIQSLSEVIRAPEQVTGVQQWLLGLVSENLPPDETFIDIWYEAMSSWYQGENYIKGLLDSLEPILQSQSTSAKWKQVISRLLARIYLDTDQQAKWQELLLQEELKEETRWQIMQSAGKKISISKFEAIQELLFREKLLSKGSAAAENFLVQTQGPFESIRRKIKHFATQPNRFEGNGLLDSLLELEEVEQQYVLIGILVEKRHHPYIAQILARWYGHNNDRDSITKLIADNQSMELLIQYFEFAINNADILGIVSNIVQEFLKTHLGPPADHKLFLLLQKIDKLKAFELKKQVELFLQEKYPLRWTSLITQIGQSY
ncbi:MAG: hypothetical protein ABIV51_01695 [Saprospiraceae bacterium]